MLAGTALFTYSVVAQSSAKLVTHFVVELSQNLYFVGLVLTYVLWGAILKLRDQVGHTRLGVNRDREITELEHDALRRQPLHHPRDA